MRVFHLVKGLGRGGAETLLVRTAPTPLASPRRNAYGYFLPWKDALVTEIESQGCQVKCFPAKNSLEMFLRLPEILRFLARWRPDIIHCHLPLAGVVGRLAGRLLGVPVVYSEHNLQERYHWATRRANHLTWTLQKQVIAVSQEVEESIASTMPAATPVQTVLNGVDCQVFHRDLSVRRDKRQELGLSDSDFVIGTVAVFRKQKRLDLWLEAASRVAATFENASFLIVGDGPERPLVEEAIARHGLSGRVILPGLESCVLPYYCAMDAFFMSSDFEGLPVALLEAMACELPVVSTTAGGIGEVIQNPEQGLLAEKGDVDALVAHLCSLCREPESARVLGARARDRVKSCFSLDKMASEIEAIYQRILGRPASAQPKKDLPGYTLDPSPALADALELITSSLGDGSERAPRTLEFLKWKHQDNPFGESYRLGVRDQGGTLAGVRFFHRWSLTSDSQVLSAVRAVDTSTHPEHQRKGIFTHLTRAGLADVQRQGVDLVFNTPNKNSLPGYLKMGWEHVGCIPVWIRPLVGVGRRAKFPDFSQLDQAFSAEAVESLLEASEQRDKLQVVKNLEYLRWRYAGHPSLQYFFSAIKSKQSLEALVIWSVTQRFGVREFDLCELFARDVASGCRLLKDVLGRVDCRVALAAYKNNPLAEEIIQAAAFKRLPFRSIDLTVLPLNERALQSAKDSNWCLSFGDIQIF